MRLIVSSFGAATGNGMMNATASTDALGVTLIGGGDCDIADDRQIDSLGNVFVASPLTS